MSKYKLVWDQTGEHIYETGTKMGVIYPQVGGKYPKGTVWNGLTAVTESPSGAEPTALYADDIKYLNILSTEDYKATVEAYYYPDAFKECNGERTIAKGVNIGQQKRKPFGLSWRTTLGNDVDDADYGYKIHILYGGTAAPSQKSHKSMNNNVDAETMSWEISTVPVSVNGFEPTASIEIDSTTVDPSKLEKLEAIIYGKADELLVEQPSDWTNNYKNYFTKSSNGELVAVTGSGSAPAFTKDKYYKAGVDARLPLPDEIAAIMSA